MKEIYTPMEKILIQAAMMAQEATKEPTTKEVVEAAIETREKYSAALALDAMLLEAEEKMGMMDGLKMEEWIL